MAKTFDFKLAGKTTVTLDGNFLRIKRKGFLNLVNHGMDGEKTIDINNVSGVQMKDAGSLTNGYIQFIVLGSGESKGGLFSATQDENTVMFAKKEQSMANNIKRYIENMLANKHSNTQPQVQPQRVDQAEEIRKYKSLLDEGIISEDEFQQKKKQLLGL